MAKLSDQDKQNLVHLKVTKLVEEIDKLFRGYEFNVIMPALISCLKRIYDGELAIPIKQRVFWFYLNQAFTLGYFGEAELGAVESKPKLVLTDAPENKPSHCIVQGCGQLAENGVYCKEHMADGGH